MATLSLRIHIVKSNNVKMMQVVYCTVYASIAIAMNGDCGCIIYVAIWVLYTYSARLCCTVALCLLM